MTSQTPLNQDAIFTAGDVIRENFGATRKIDHLACTAIAERAVSAYLAVAQPVVRGYIIVDKKTNAIDWDGELHTSIESAIESMTGPRQSMCRTAEEEDDAANDGRTAWWRIYSIHAVTDGPEVNDA